jgi:pyruvate,water dikinase
VAEGSVRVVHDASEFGKLRAGEVLVAPYTNPAWTPLFERAAAVVVDSGGPASHAAIVAREYGIPAVMATVEGTQRLVDGQRVRVDGAAGLVLSTGQQ